MYVNMCACLCVFVCVCKHVHAAVLADKGTCGSHRLMPGCLPPHFSTLFFESGLPIECKICPFFLDQLASKHLRCAGL